VKKKRKGESLLYLAGTKEEGESNLISLRFTEKEREGRSRPMEKKRKKRATSFLQHEGEGQDRFKEKKEKGGRLLPKGGGKGKKISKPMSLFEAVKGGPWI